MLQTTNTPRSPNTNSIRALYMMYRWEKFQTYDFPHLPRCLRPDPAGRFGAVPATIAILDGRADLSIISGILSL